MDGNDEEKAELALAADTSDRLLSKDLDTSDRRWSQNFRLDVSAASASSAFSSSLPSISSLV